MEHQEVEEIIDCLPKGEMAFYYFKDRYALLLLELVLDRPMTKRELKHTAFSQLLEKSVIKSVLREQRGKPLTGETFKWSVFGDPQAYNLSLSTWGSKRATWVQTTRRGYNLVLQLNFSQAHDQYYRRLVDPEGLAPFAYDDHPVNFGKRNTLAWARLDIDLQHGEALIEEIQNDWFRYAERARRYANGPRDRFWFRGAQLRSDDLVEYCDTELAKHSHWDEAMLAATIWFLRAEVGISRIFYHSHASGAQIKRTGARQPPRSVYTRLPRKFCFRDSDERPAFLSGSVRTNCSKRAVKNATFQILDYSEYRRQLSR